MKSIKFSKSRYVPWIMTFFCFFAVLYIPIPASCQNTHLLNTSSVLTTAVSPGLKMNEVSSRAARHFMKNFPTTPTEKWTRVDDFYVASFTDGSIPVKAYYNAKGVFAHCVKSYPGALLNDEIRFSILKKFEGYNIDVVTEINNLEQQLYFIKIRNDNNFKTLKIVNNTIEITEDLSYIGS